MRIDKRILSFIVISLLVVSIVSVFWVQLFKVSAQGIGNLTGTISDGGVDTDPDGTFDYLEVGVEVNVTTSGTFQVEVSGLFDSAYNYISVSDQDSLDLDVGVHFVNLSLDGSSIYASGLNPVSVSNIYLYDEYYNMLDHLFDVPLSKEYSFSEFDSPTPPPAFLTGTTYDSGVDTDGDGAFDYLEVSVEVNVTNSGEYEVEILDLQDSDYNKLNVRGSKSEYLDAGVHIVNVWLYGPTIYVIGLDPMNVSGIALYSMEYVPPLTYNETWIGGVHDVTLSREYLYTEFDSPFADIETIFVVYPDGRVVMEGALDYTHMEPLNTGPSVYGVVNIEKSGTLTLLSADFTLTIPLEETSRFPFNSSIFTVVSEYFDDFLATTISGSTILPPTIASEFPFNVSDFTVTGDYVGDMVSGTAVVDILSGFPLEDIEIDFQGNATYVYLNGSTTVIFGTYPDIGEIGEINATVLDYLLQEINSTIPGTGPDSLYDMTGGLFECTDLNTTATPYGVIGATVDFEAEFVGDLIQTFVTMSGQPESMYEVLSSAWSSVESGSFVLTYSHALKQADMDLFFVNNLTYLIDNLIPTLPDILSPTEAELIALILNTTYCTVDSAQFSLDYVNGQATLTTTATIQDDFNAELDYIKSIFLTYAYSEPLPLPLQIINETQIDITNFRISFNLTETSLEGDLNGLAVLPQIDVINATNFQLERFFNITASAEEEEPPIGGQRLKVTVEGGSNVTHTVRIIRPGNVPEPNISAPGGMVWNNQSISGLKDLIFHIGAPDTTPPVIDTPVQTPEIADDWEAVTISVNVTDADTGIPPEGVILSYRKNGGAWNNVTMSKTNGDTYEEVIPGSPAGTQVEYIIIAHDYANNEAIKDNAGNYYVYTVIPEFSTWQIIAVLLLLLGTVVFFAKKLRNITGIPKHSNNVLKFFALTGATIARRIQSKATVKRN